MLSITVVDIKYKIYRKIVCKYFLNPNFFYFNLHHRWNLLTFELLR